MAVSMQKRMKVATNFFPVPVVVKLVLGSFMLLGCTRAFYTKYDHVIELDPSNFQEQVMESKGVWMIEFYAPWCGHCKSLTPEWKKTAEALSGIVHVAAVDADKHRSLAQTYQVQGFPSIKIFGEDKKKPVDYNGQRTAQALVDEGISQVRSISRSRLNGKSSKGKKSESKPSSKPSSSKSKKPSSKETVVTLTDDNFDATVLNSNELWLVEFYAPWCGHCKKLAPEWEQAAMELQGQVKLGALDATANQAKAGLYGIQGYPTIKMFAPGSSKAIDYNGPREASGIVSYALQQLEKYGGGFKLPEFTSQEVLEEHCSGNAICVVSFLPHIYDSQKKGREKYFETLEKSSKAAKGPFRFGWIQGTDQIALEGELGLSFGYPSMVAINLNKQRFAILRGSFTQSAITKFLNGLISGSQKTTEFKDLPNLKKVKPWDGKDAKLPDEGDVGDDIMEEIMNLKEEL